MEVLPTLKILTLGDASVGKTSVLLRFAENDFPTATMPTIGIEYKTKTITLENREVKLQVWDTAGQERYHKTLANTFYRRANGILLVFDLSDRSTFNHVENWMKQIKNKADEKVAILLVGNKMDLLEGERFPEGEQLAASYSIPFVMVSAKSGKNVEYAFKKLAELISTQDPGVISGDSRTSNIQLQEQKRDHPSGDKCCR